MKNENINESLLYNMPNHQKKDISQKLYELPNMDNFINLIYFNDN